MKILTDEHVPPAVANTLRSEGIEAITIYDTEENDYAILTNDQHFVSKQFVEECDHCGIFFYEDQRTPRSDIVRAVHNALSVLRPEDLRNEIIYVPGGWL